MRALPFLILAALAPAAIAQDATVPAPAKGVGSYDPQLSAKEAVLANWELVASGIRAGQVVSRQVVELADEGVPYPYLAKQAAFAQKTMVQRYASAQWVHEGGESEAIRAAVLAAEAECAAEPCDAEREALRAAFLAAGEDLGAAAAVAREALTEREDGVDAVLLSEQLSLIADYLEGGEWAEELTLGDLGRDGEEVAARIVGAISIWRNVEPYVGLTDQEVDDAINAASQQLLRTLRRETREAGALHPEGPELMSIGAAAEALAAEFRRAAALFVA
jgi:hypothetical protein